MSNDTPPNPQAAAAGSHTNHESESQSPSAPPRTAGASSSSTGDIGLKDYQCHLVWKHTTNANRMPGRQLLNQTIRAHSAASLAALAYQKAFTHAAESTAIKAEDRGFMVIGSAFVPTGDAGELTEINTNPSTESVTHVKHYLNFRKDEGHGSKIYVIPNDQEALSMQDFTLVVSRTGT